MRALAFVRSLAILVVASVAVPVGLIAASQWRFGGASPLHGVPRPDRFTVDGFGSILSEPLIDRALADVAVRSAMVVAWLAVGVFVITVVAETAHMMRFGGHHL